MRTKRKTKADRLIEQAVDKAVGRALAGRPVPIMSIPKIYNRAWELVCAGHTEGHLEAQLTQYVMTLEVRTPA